MKDKNAHLETSLSAETRLKLDLFSALGDAKRQMEIQQGQADGHSLMIVCLFYWFTVCFTVLSIYRCLWNACLYDFQ